MKMERDGCGMGKNEKMERKKLGEKIIQRRDNTVDEITVTVFEDMVEIMDSNIMSTEIVLLSKEEFEKIAEFVREVWDKMSEGKNISSP